MTGWIIAGIVVLLLIIASCMEVSARWSRIEEVERAILLPCPVCGETPHLGYCCGEYMIQGDNPKCPCCGIAFSEMHTDPRLMIDAWNRRAEDG